MSNIIYCARCVLDNPRIPLHEDHEAITISKGSAVCERHFRSKPKVVEEKRFHCFICKKDITGDHGLPRGDSWVNNQIGKTTYFCSKPHFELGRIKFASS